MHFVGAFVIKTFADWNKTAKFVKVLSSKVSSYSIQ